MMQVKKYNIPYAIYINENQFHNSNKLIKWNTSYREVQLPYMNKILIHDSSLDVDT
jgi:hypothetical protein